MKRRASKQPDTLKLSDWDLSRLRYNWEPRPMGWGFLNAGIECDGCHRWQSAYHGTKTENVDTYTKSGWIDLSKYRDDTGLRTWPEVAHHACAFCRVYGLAASIEISNAELALKKATFKRDHWGTVVTREQNLLALLKKEP